MPLADFPFFADLVSYWPQIARGLRETILLSVTITVTCLIGASGCGKSTLLRCTNLLEEIQHGSIWLKETDLAQGHLDAGLLGELLHPGLRHGFVLGVVHRDFARGCSG